MKVFFLCGPNPNNLSGMSCKVWKIQREGRRITTWWGRADVVNRKVTPVGELQSKARRFASEEAAAEHESRRIAHKLAKGYDRKPRRKTA